MIKLRVFSAFAGLLLAGGCALAANEPNSQQNKMSVCNKEAGEKDLKGDERKAFMSKCLSAKKVSQQDKMKSCNVEAKDMKGDERKAFMSKCLKG